MSAAQERPEWKTFEVEKNAARAELLAFINADTHTLLQRFGRHEFIQIVHELVCFSTAAFSIGERVCANVKRWHPGDQRERWVGSGLLVAEKQFRRVQGHKQIPILLRELEALVPTKSEMVKRRKAS